MIKIATVLLFVISLSCAHNKDKESFNDKKNQPELSQEEIIIMSEKKCSEVPNLELHRLVCQMDHVLNYCRNHPANRSRICYQAISTCLQTKKDIGECLPEE